MAKEPFSKGQRRCIFCGATGITREHMWPDWLKAYIPRTLTQHHTRSALLYPDEETVTLKRQTGDPHSRRLPVVCRPCNNEWMSQLQETTKPILVPMLTGKSTTILRKDQTALAAWIAMTTMVAEFCNPDRLGIEQPDRAWLREHLTAPSHWRIWLGRHNRKQFSMYSHNVLTFTEKQEIKPAPRSFVPEGNAQTSTICLGEHLLIHVMSSRIGRNIIRKWRLPAAVTKGVVQIWPIRSSSVRWPPPGFIFNDAGIDFLANEFFRKVTLHIQLKMIGA